MKFQAEFSFFEQLLRNFHIPCHKVTYPFENVPDLDSGIRRILNPQIDFTSLMVFTPEQVADKKFYCIEDKFACNYIFFKVSEQDAITFYFIGPYLFTPPSTNELYKYAEYFSIPTGLISQLKQYYYSLTRLPFQSFLMNLVITLGEKIWGSVDNFAIEEVKLNGLTKKDYEYASVNYQETESPLVSMKLLEERYEAESHFMQAVAQGQFLKAEKCFPSYNMTNLEPRTTDCLRNNKNYAVILNTLLRKSAEYGSVHPYHIDSLSSRFAHKIESATSMKELEQLQREMIHKYCILVKNHSMKGYSLLVRKVLTQIDTDLASNLSLNAIASSLNVNSSYLSTLFKKETGSTLTEYVNRKRIDHAILLLNSTNLQIQTIAQHCGISDVNYFTKLFKKQIGKTPKEYRDSIGLHK